MRAIDPRALGDEWTILQPDFIAYERRHGSRPTVCALDAAVPAFVVRYPRLPPESLPRGGYLYQAPQQFLQPPLVQHLASLGFFVDDDLVVRTVPTPATFERLMQLAGFADRGYRAALVRTPSTSMPPAAWLSHVIDGRFPINIASRWFHAASRIARRTPLARAFRVEPADLGLLVHDVGVHILATHLLPRTDIRDIGQRLQGRRPARAAAFFEGDLTRYCQELWREARSVAEFDAIHRQRRPALMALVDQV